MSCRGIRLVPVERSTSVDYKLYQWFGRQCCRSESMVT